jgi:hypothetical protein
MKRQKPLKVVLAKRPPRLTKEAARILLKILREADERDASAESRQTRDVD